MELFKLYREAHPEKKLGEAKQLLPSSADMERFAREQGLTLESVVVDETEEHSIHQVVPASSMPDDELREAHDLQKAIMKSHEEDEATDTRREDRMEELEDEMERRKLDDYAHLTDAGSTVVSPLAATNVPGSSYVSPDGATYQRPDGGSYLRPPENLPTPVSQTSAASASDAKTAKAPESNKEIPLSERPRNELPDEDLGPIPDSIRGLEKYIAEIEMIFNSRDEQLLGPWPAKKRKELLDRHGEAKSRLEELNGAADSGGDDVEFSENDRRAAHALWVQLMSRNASAGDFLAVDDAASLSSLASLVSVTRDIMTEHPNAPVFELVAKELLGFLRPVLASWHDKLANSSSNLSDADRQKFHRQLHRCRARLHGIRQALDALRQGNPYQTEWVMPDEFELEELRKEAGIPVFDEEITPPAEELKAANREVGGKFVASRQASESELCLNIDIYAEALTQTFKSAAEENDFVFALYGPWGRGKSTLISKVAGLLAKRLPQEADAPYETVFFSAWKYPTRPEVWVHLYQRLAAAAQAGSWWQKIRISLRVGLVKNGWWPLLFGFGLLALSRLQLDFAHWIFDGIGVVGLLILGSFVWNAVKTGKQMATTYFAMPDHAEKLGLQAVIGEDFKQLLEVWTRPQPAKTAESATPSTCDFSKWWPARWAMISVVALIWATLGLIAWKIHHHLPDTQAKVAFQSLPIGSVSQDGKASSEPVAAATPTLPIRIEVNAEWQGGKLRWAGTSPQNEKPQAAQPKSQGSVLFLDVLFGLIGIATPLFAFLISKRPRQCRRVLLVVDDLDRCEPEQMLTVIESLRLFLDEPEMSRRMQVAMLLDRNILKSAMLNRAEAQKLRIATDSQEDFLRQQEEKLFVVSMALPPIDGGMLNTLAKNMVQREVRQQEAAREDRSRPKAPVISTASAVESASRGQSSQPLSSKASEVRSKDAAPDDTERNSVLTEVQFSLEEQRLLVEALAEIDVSNITPRSYRAFVLRYQLVRLILQGFKTVFQPSGVISEIAGRLFVPKGGRSLSALSPEVLTAVNSVVIDDK